MISRWLQLKQRLLLLTLCIVLPIILPTANGATPDSDSLNPAPLDLAELNTWQLTSESSPHSLPPQIQPNSQLGTSLKRNDGSGFEHVKWLAISIPSQQWRDPYLYLLLPEIQGEIYINQTPVATLDSSPFRTQVFGTLVGKKIRLQSTSATQTLSIRLDTPFSGLPPSAQILVGNAGTIDSQILAHNTPKLALSITALSLAFFSLAVYLTARDRIDLFTTLFYLTSAISILSYTLPIKMMVSDLQWLLYPGYLATYAIPFLLTKIVKKSVTISDATSFRAARIISTVVLTIALLGILIPGLANDGLTQLLNVFCVITLAVLLVPLVKCSLQGNREILIMVYALLILSLSAAVSLTSNLLLNKAPETEFTWGYFLCLFFLGISQFRRYALNSRALRQLNNNLEQQINSRTQEMKQQNVTLSKANRKLHQLATMDNLTGTYNRRHFFDLLEKEWLRVNRYKAPVSILMLDIDHFKSINDTHGHAAGDRVLYRLGRLCQSAIREIDFIGRVGGEEFAICLRETTLDGAIELGERLIQEVAHTEIALLNHKTITITASIGAAELNQNHGSISDIMKEADEALYLAKRNGRNQLKTLPVPLNPNEPEALSGSAETAAQ